MRRLLLLVTASALLVAAGATTATAAPPPGRGPSALTTIDGTVRWTHGKDARVDQVTVFACLASDPHPCPSLTATEALPDGSYRLVLPSAGVWNVAVLAGADGSRIMNDATTVLVPRFGRRLHLTIDAIVAEVHIVDGNGNGFPPHTDGTGGGAGVTYCEAVLWPDHCFTNAFGVGVGVDHDGDGDALAMVEPDVTYSIDGYARTDPDPMKWSYSGRIQVLGSQLNGTTFVIP